MGRQDGRGLLSTQDFIDTKITEDQLEQYVSKYNDAILLAPLAIQKSMLLVDQALMDLDDAALEKKYPCAEKTHNLRVSFWEEYHQALKDMRPMDIHNVYNKVCTQNYFFSFVIKSTKHCVWLYRPTKNYHLDRDQTLREGLERIREIIALPIKDPSGKINTAAANLILRAVKMIDDRVNGSTTPPMVMLQTPQKELPKDISELEEKIKMLEAKHFSSTPHIPEVLPK